jgi:hypothetical protein
MWMAESPFKFFRGAAINIQARDLANARVSGIIQTVRELIGSINTGAFIGTYLNASTATLYCLLARLRE